MGSTIGKVLLAVGSRPGLERRLRPVLAPLVGAFVAGEALVDACSVAEDLAGRGRGTILDLLGEDVESGSQADQAVEALSEAAKEIEALHLEARFGVKGELAVKPSQVGARQDPLAARRRLERLAEVAASSVGVWLDMEDSGLTETTLGLYEALQPSWPGLGVAIQAALRRSPADIVRLAPLRPRIRLVKGAYLEPVDVAYQRRDEVRRAYRALGEQCLEAGCDLAIASHDRPLVSSLLRRADQLRAPGSEVEVQLLYGVAPGLADDLVADGVRVKVYVPYGTAWYPYYLRRLAERPANLVFAGKAVVASALDRRARQARAQTSPTDQPEERSRP